MKYVVLIISDVWALQQSYEPLIAQKAPCLDLDLDICVLCIVYELRDEGEGR